MVIYKNYVSKLFMINLCKGIKKMADDNKTEG